MQRLLKRKLWIFISKTAIIQDKVSFAGIVELTSMLHKYFILSSNSLILIFANLVFRPVNYLFKALKKWKNYHSWQPRIREWLSLLINLAFAKENVGFKYVDFYYKIKFSIVRRLLSLSIFQNIYKHFIVYLKYSIFFSKTQSSKI
jgi:hypothetical protein